MKDKHYDFINICFDTHVFVFNLQEVMNDLNQT